MTARTPASRFSTYSGAPSLQPSLAPTLNSSPDTTTTVTNTDTTLSSGRGAPPRNHRASVLFSSQPAPDASNATLNATDPAKAEDIQSWSGALERMQDSRLDKQRYVMSTGKNEEVSKLALGAKFERALAHRMTGQDALDPRAELAPSQRGVEGGEKKAAVAAAAN